MSPRAPGTDAARTSGPIALTQGVTAELPAAPVADYVNAAWPRPERIILSGGHDPDARESRPLWELAPDGSRLAALELGLDPAGSPSVERRSLGGVTTLSDGRIGLVDVAERPGGRTTCELHAYDLDADTLETLVELDGPVDSYAWSPDLERALIARSSGIWAGIGLVTRGGPRPFALEIADGAVSWRVDAPLARARGADDTADGRAKGPAWSPDGGRVALLASPQSVGLTGAARIDAPWNLYVIDGARRTLAVAVREILEPSPPVWSPDGSRIAFLGGLRGGPRGIFLLRVADGRLTALARGEIAPACFSPDGRRLLAIRRLSAFGEWPPRSELVLLRPGG